MLLGLPILVAGCGTLTDVATPVYSPVAIHIYAPSQYEADVRECLEFAAGKFKPSMNIGTVASKTFDGATSNSSLWALNPLVPAYGAAGALAGTLADGLYGLGGSRFTVAKNCVHDETQIDKSAVVANPGN